jgi:hypothetical protein
MLAAKNTLTKDDAQAVETALKASWPNGRATGLSKPPPPALLQMRLAAMGHSS